MSNPEERPVIKLDAQGVLDFILSSRYFKQLFANDTPDGAEWFSDMAAYRGANGATHDYSDFRRKARPEGTHQAQASGFAVEAAGSRRAVRRCRGS